MKALTVQQPYAELIALGAKTWEARSWATPHVGVRLAIHAAGKPVSAAILLAEARRDRHLAYCLDRFTWHNRDALAALPCMAVTGTVTLARIVRARDLDFVPAMVGALEGDEYLWEFTDAVSFPPIGGIAGAQKVWDLSPEHVATVERAEEHARATARARADVVAPSPEWLRAATRIEKNAAFWQQLREFLDEQERIRRIDGDLGYSIFRDPGFERLFRRALRGYVSTHQVRGNGVTSEVRIDQRNAVLHQWFPDDEWLPVDILERVLREQLCYEGADYMLRRDGEIPKYPRYHHWVNGEWVDENHIAPMWGRHWEFDTMPGFGEEIASADDLLKHPGGRPRKDRSD